MSSDTAIHLGFWTNWSKGAVLGSTLTLPSRNGAILVAALAIFIHLAGRQSWSIICFLAHQMRATKEARDGSFHQEQAILRNNVSDLNSLWQLTNVWWAWHYVCGWRFMASFTLICLGVFHLVAFSAASILAFHITDAGNQVLIAPSSSCGPWFPLLTPFENIPLTLMDAFDDYLNVISVASEDYVQGCLGDSQSLPECGKFKKKQLKWTSTKVSCPFGGLCLGPPNGTLQMTTGLLDSRDDLGINSRDEDRVQFRKVAACAPLKSDGYYKNGTTSIKYRSFSEGTHGTITVNYTAAFYGPTQTNLTLLGLSDPAFANMTLIYTNFRDAATTFQNSFESSYDLQFEMFEPASMDLSSFTPVPELSLPNNTVELIFASFYGTYAGVSDDPWLPAHLKGPVVSDVISNTRETQVYFPDRRLSALACTEQVQICNPSSVSGLQGKCTPLQSLIELAQYTSADFQDVLTNDHQRATAWALAQALYYSNFYNTISSLATPLLADQLCVAEQSLPIANNQWELESLNWFNIGLALVQQFAVSYITGPPEDFTSWVPQNQGDHNASLNWLCESQIIRRTDYDNFSTLAISLIFGLGSILICSSLWLETIVGWFRYRYSRWEQGRWRQRVWWAEGTLQLQRRVFEEEIGIKGWHSEDWNKVPVTKSGRVWSVLTEWNTGIQTFQGRKVTNWEKDASSPVTISESLLNEYEKRPIALGLKRIRSNSI